MDERSEEFRLGVFHRLIPLPLFELEYEASAGVQTHRERVGEIRNSFSYLERLGVGIWSSLKYTPEEDW